jgi:hypothetical protein
VKVGDIASTCSRRSKTPRPRARALRGAARRREFLGLSETTVDRAADVLGSALAGGRRLTRAECIAALVDGGVPEAADHGYHFLWYISQIGVTCIGPQVGKEQTFVLLDEWVPKPRQLDRDEALAELAVRFVRSHGPVTRHDLARWTGLTMTDAKAGLAAASDVLTEVDCATSDGPTAMWVTDDALEAALDVDGRPGLDDPEPVVLLPGFDEYMLGYGDRSAMLDPAFNQRICPGNNGMFKPTIVGGGTVLGTWKRTVKTSTVDIDLDPFAPLPSAVRGGIDAAAERYGSSTAATPGSHSPPADRSGLTFNQQNSRNSGAESAARARFGLPTSGPCRNSGAESAARARFGLPTSPGVPVAGWLTGRRWCRRGSWRRIAS